MRRLCAFFCAALIITMLPATAADKPTEIEPYIHATAPYGSGQYSALFMTVYDADLWTDAAPWSWNTLFALSLHYHINIDGGDLSNKSVEKIDSLYPLTVEQTKDYTSQLNTIFPDVHSGDEITAVYIPAKELLFYYNGKPIGTLTDPVFARRFLSIWFSEKTSAPRLRRQLLALTSHDQGESP